jgi:hypothetical protein
MKKVGELRELLAILKQLQVYKFTTPLASRTTISKILNTAPIAWISSGHFFALEAFSNTLLRVYLLF